MKVKTIVLTAVAVFAALATTAVAAGDYEVITGDELNAMLSSERPVTIVDVREPELFASGHIPGAINIPYDGADERVVNELSKDEAIVFVCHGGPMGDELAELLARNGFSEVYNLRGGMRWWRGKLEK